MKIFGKKKREIERLNKELNIARSGSVEKFYALREVVNRPFSDESIKIKLIYSLDEKLERIAWAGCKGEDQNNFDGMNNLI